LKLSLSELLSGYRSTETLNENFNDIQDALENTLSRDGTTPNDMGANLDMGDHRIINVTDPSDPQDAATKAYVDSVAVTGVVGPIGPTGPQGEPGPTGPAGATGGTGANGSDGWVPVFSVVSDGTRRVLQVSDYTGGTGTKPTTGLYVSASGLTATLASAVDIRGATGAAGAGSGDLISTNNLSDVSNAATSRTNLGLGTAATHAHTDYALATHTHVANDISNATTVGKAVLTAVDESAGRTALALGTAATHAHTDYAASSHTHVASNITDPTNIKSVESFIVALSDETTAITTGTAKVTMRMPYAFTVTDVRASINTVSSSGVVTVDINEGGSSILSTKLTIDANEKTSTTAATGYVLSDSSLADDSEITFDIDTAGTGAKGLKVIIIGHRT